MEVNRYIAPLTRGCGLCLQFEKYALLVRLISSLWSPAYDPHKNRVKTGSSGGEALGAVRLIPDEQAGKQALKRHILEDSVTVDCAVNGRQQLGNHLGTQVPYLR